MICEKLERNGRKISLFMGSGSKYGASSAAPLTIYRNPIKTRGNWTDRQLLHYYQFVASAELSGVHTTRFWNTIVLQQSQEEPVLWQALVALGSTHQDFVLGGNTAESDQLTSLWQYNKAINQLGRYIGLSGRPSRKTVLLCCAVLYCAACAMGKFDDAQLHLQAGLTTIHQFMVDSGKSMAVHAVSETDDFKYLLHVYAWMDTQATFRDPSRPPFLSSVADDPITQGISWIPEKFHSPSGAQMALEILHGRVVHFLTFNRDVKNVPVEHLPPLVIKMKAMLDRQMTSWKSAFDRSMERESFQRTAADQHHIAHTELQYRSLSVVLHGGLEAGSEFSLCRDFDPDLREIFSIIKSILKNPTDEHASNRNHAQRSFSFSTGILPQLCGVLFKCRDRDLRCEALALLKESPRREGLTDSETLAQVFEQLAIAVDVENEKIPRGSQISLEQYACRINEQCTKATTFPAFSLLEE
jgi:hypothetical protein